MLVIGGVANRHNGDQMTSSDTSSHHVVTKADVDAVKWRGPGHFAIAANIYWIHILMWNGKNKGTGGDLQELAGLCRSSTEVSLLPCVRLTSSLVDIQSSSSGQGWHQSWNGCSGFLIYTADQRSCMSNLRGPWIISPSPVREAVLSTARVRFHIYNAAVCTHRPYSYVTGFSKHIILLI